MPSRDDRVLQRDAARISQPEIHDQKASKTNGNLEQARHRDTQLQGVAGDRVKVDFPLVAYDLVERRESRPVDADSLEEFIESGFGAGQIFADTEFDESMHPTDIEAIRKTQTPRPIDLDATACEFFHDLRNETSNNFIHVLDVQASAGWRRAPIARLIRTQGRIDRIRRLREVLLERDGIV